MRIVVLGGCGFIGSHVAEQLVRKGHEVGIFARRNVDRRNVEAIRSEVQFIGGDFRNSEDIRVAVRGADTVIHAVGSTLPGNSLINPVFDIQANVVASVNLLTACVEAKVRKVVFISSGGTVYGIPKAELISEGHPLDPINPYGLSKLTVEKFFGVFHHQYGLDHTILRLSNPYGTRQREGSGQGVIGAWMDCLRQDKPIELWGDGSSVRDYLAVEDAAAAIVLAAESDGCPKVMNVGSGRGYSLAEVLALIEVCVGRSADVLHREARRVDVPRNVLDVSLAEQALGWKVKIPLEQGLRATWLKT